MLAIEAPTASVGGLTFGSPNFKMLPEPLQKARSSFVCNPQSAYKHVTRYYNLFVPNPFDEGRQSRQSTQIDASRPTQK